MKRYLSLMLEGAVLGGVLGFLAAFIYRNLPLTLLVGIIAGAVIRLLIDYIWKIYNQLTGKSLD